jgi:hypothetical protein
MPECGYADGGDGAVDQDVDMKEELDEMKHRVDSIATELCELRVQVYKLKMTMLTVNFRQPRVLVIHWFRL